MAYSKTTWIDNEAPYLNATNLNKIENGIYNNGVATDAVSKEIEGFEEDISDNARNISGNATDIAKNAEAILDNSEAILENAGDIANNKTDIDINANNILGLSVGELYQGTWTPQSGTEYPASPEAGWSYYIQFLDDNGYEFLGGDLTGRVANNGDKIIYNGTTWSMLDNTNEQLGYYLVDDISSMLSLSPLHGALCQTYGYHEANDGGGGTFNYDDTQSGTNNGGTILDGWIRQYDGEVNVKWFGAKGDNIADDTAAIQSAIDAHDSVIMPNGEFRVTQLLLSSGQTIDGVDRDTCRIFKTTAEDTITNRNISSSSARTDNTIAIQNITFDGSEMPVTRWLSNLAGDEITDPEADYEVGGIIGDGGDINDVVNADRRNPNYTETSESMIRLSKCENVSIYSCRFKEHKANCISEGGGKNIVIEQNVFNGVGKNDGPFHAIWTQSYGDPDAPGTAYQDSENILIKNNKATRLERSFILFGCTKGGLVESNFIDGYGESAIFCNSNLNRNGGTSIISNNTILNGVITDITGLGIECDGINDLKIINNTIKNSGTAAAKLVGAQNMIFTSNTLEDCFNADSYPYGPYSERYAYDVGGTPIAGDPITQKRYVRTGSLGTVGNDNLMINNNVFIDNGVNNVLYYFSLEKAGGDNLSKDIIIANNSFNNESIGFIDTSVGNVMDANMSLHIKNNLGHTSIAPVLYSKDVASDETGVITVDIGFRPSSIQTLSTLSNAYAGTSWVGVMAWEVDDLTDPTGIANTTDGNGNYSALKVNDYIRLVDGSNTTIALVEFVGWTETGFGVNVITATNPFNFRALCYP